MRTAAVLAATSVALVLQTGLARFVPGDLAIDFVLVVVVFVALTSGPVTGLLTGAIAGIAQDALATGIIGIGGLAKTIVGFLAGVVGTQFIVTQTPVRFVVFLMATALHAAVFIGLYAVLGLREFGSPYRAILEQGVVNAVLGVIAFRLSEFLPGAMARRRQTRAK